MERKKLYILVIIVCILILIFTGIIPIRKLFSSNVPTWKFNNEWTECSKTCGGGTRNKQSSCKTSYGKQVDDSKCSGTKPLAKLEVCNTQDCPLPSEWREGLDSNWSVCSEPCGPGIQTRQYVCKKGNEDSDECDTPQPAVQSQECNLGECPIETFTYSY